MMRQSGTYSLRAGADDAREDMTGRGIPIYLQPWVFKPGFIRTEGVE